MLKSPQHRAGPQHSSSHRLSIFQRAGKWTRSRVYRPKTQSARLLRPRFQATHSSLEISSRAFAEPTLDGSFSPSQFSVDDLIKIFSFFVWITKSQAAALCRLVLFPTQAFAVDPAQGCLASTAVWCPTGKSWQLHSTQRKHQCI